MANTVFLRISDSRILNGPVMAKGREGTFRVLSIDHKVSVRKNSRGLVDAARIHHHPFEVLVELCAAQPTLAQALKRGYRLQKVDLEFWHSLPSGLEVRYHVITWEQMNIEALTLTMERTNDPDTAEAPVLCRLRFGYEAILWLHDDGYLFAFAELVKGASGFARELNALLPLEPQMQTENTEDKPEEVQLVNFRWLDKELMFGREARLGCDVVWPKGQEHMTRLLSDFMTETDRGSEKSTHGEFHAQPDGTAVMTYPLHAPDAEGATVKIWANVRHRLSKLYNLTHLMREVLETALLSEDHALVPGIAFLENSSFIGPQVVDGLKTLEQKFTEWKKEKPKGVIAVYGHTDKDEKEPKALSERRAQSAYAFITNDAGTWEDLYHLEKWGLKSLQVLLKDLGHYTGKPDGEGGPKTEAAFKALQKKAGLPETGTEGAATRKAIFEAYMKGKHDIKLDADCFRKVHQHPWMGCAAYNRVNPSDDAAPENRRVTFVLLYESENFRARFPCRDGQENPCKGECSGDGKRSAPGIKCGYYDRLVREEKQAEAKDEPAEEKIKLSEAQEIAFEVTSGFEGPGYFALAGDGDNQGLSFGCMQWNIGQGTLQPLWKKFWGQDPKAFRDCFGTHDDAFAEVEKIITGTTNSKALEWARSTHDLVKKNAVWKAPWKDVFHNLAMVSDFQKIQRTEAGTLNHPPTIKIIVWLRKELPDLFSLFELRSYAALFDLCNQQGSLKSEDYKEIGSLYKKSPPTNQKDAVELLCAKRALTANPIWKADSGSRRLGILAATPQAFPNEKYPSPKLKTVTRPNKKFDLLNPNPLIEDL